MAGKKSRVLIVDDDRTNIRVLGAILEDDYELSVALSGEQALGLIASDIHLDAIVLDIQMPGMSGVELARTLRADEQQYGEAAHIPIIAVTGSSEDDDPSEYTEAGINAVLSKPVSPEALKAELEHWLNIPYC